MVWKPHVTVAAVIEKEQRFLLVEEQTLHGIAFNQPAGHLEPGEDLIAAVKREVYEETAWRFDPENLLGIHLWRANPKAPSFLRFCFSGRCHSFQPEQPLDDEIIATHWLSRNEITASGINLRSPLVLKSIDQYLNGEQHELAQLTSSIDLQT